MSKYYPLAFLHRGGTPQWRNRHGITNCALVNFPLISQCPGKFPPDVLEANGIDETGLWDAGGDIRRLRTLLGKGLDITHADCHVYVFVDNLDLIYPNSRAASAGGNIGPADDFDAFVRMLREMGGFSTRQVRKCVLVTTRTPCARRYLEHREIDLTKNDEVGVTPCVSVRLLAHPQIIPGNRK